MADAFETAKQLFIEGVGDFEAGRLEDAQTKFEVVA